MNRKIHIYQSPLQDELVTMFSDFHDGIRIETVEDNVITLVDQDFYNEEPFDFEQLFELLQDDFSGGISMVIEPYTPQPFQLEQSIKQFFTQLPSNLYTFEDIIIQAVLRHQEGLKQDIKDYLNTLVNSDVIHTVRAFIDNNLNSSTTAKKLYMHRNTLNYRIDNFIEATRINVKTFKGANAIYMLYTY